MFIWIDEGESSKGTVYRGSPFVLTLAENFSYPGNFQCKSARVVGGPDGRRFTNLESQAHRTRIWVQIRECIAFNETFEVAAQNSGDWDATHGGASRPKSDESLPATVGIVVRVASDKREECSADIPAALQEARVSHDVVG